MTSRRTGSGWTDAEEIDFAELQHLGGMDRMAAIRLFRRCAGDFEKARKAAMRQAVSQEVRARLAKARTVRGVRA
jgi:hypothetical protein